MTKEETSELLAVLSIAGVKFEGDKKLILDMWSECLSDIEYIHALKATKDIIKNETEIFANGLIAKVRQRAKFFRDLATAEGNMLESQSRNREDFVKGKKERKWVEIKKLI